MQTQPAADEADSDIYYMRNLNKVKPIYEEIEGWNQDINKASSFSDLPKNAQRYINRIEEKRILKQYNELFNAL